MSDGAARSGNPGGDARDRNPLDSLAENFVARLRRGESPSVADYAQRHPELAAEIAELFPTLRLMEDLKPASNSGELPVDAPEPPERIGDFRIVREVGRGGMGIVYEAMQETLDRRVALKVLPESALLSPRRQERFRREARAAAQLHHTHIVTVYGVGEDDGLCYSVMQFIDGQSLDVVLDELRRASRADRGGVAVGLPEVGSAEYWRWVAGAGADLADALAHAHELGTLHRDIKPGNLIVDGAGHVWVTDFGLAKLAETDDLTQAGHLLGTLRYMAPEQLDGKHSAASDIYSLGITLYELLTLRPAFTEEERAHLVRRIAHESPAAPRSLDPRIPRDLETVVLKATAREPGRRYARAEDLADDLRRVLEDRPIAARRATPLERFGRWCRRNRALAAATILAALSLVAAAAAGWIGYVETRDALSEASRKTTEALDATALAQRNVELSLDALGKIFDGLALQDFARRTRPRFRIPGQPGPDGPPDGATDTPADSALLESVLDFYERFAEVNETDPRLQLEAARAYGRVAQLHARFGNAEREQSAARRTRELLTTLVAADPDQPEARRELARTLLADVEWGRVGEDRLAESLDRAVDLLDVSPAGDRAPVRPDHPAGSSRGGPGGPDLPLLARALTWRGALRRERGDADEAVVDLERARDLWRRQVQVPGPRHGEEWFRTVLELGRALVTRAGEGDRATACTLVHDAAMRQLTGERGLRGPPFRGPPGTLALPRAQLEAAARALEEWDEPALARELRTRLRELPGRGRGPRRGRGGR